MIGRIVWNTEEYQPFAKVSQKMPKSLAFAKDYFCKRYNRSTNRKPLSYEWLQKVHKNKA